MNAYLKLAALAALAAAAFIGGALIAMGPIKTASPTVQSTQVL